MPVSKCEILPLRIWEVGRVKYCGFLSNVNVLIGDSLEASQLQQRSYNPMKDAFLILLV